jgi:hypothetical protein
MRFSIKKRLKDILKAFFDNPAAPFHRSLTAHADQRDLFCLMRRISSTRHMTTAAAAAKSNNMSNQWLLFMAFSISRMAAPFPQNCLYISPFSAKLFAIQNNKLL